MKKTTRQLTEWTGDFGREYTDRNIFGPRRLQRFYTERYGVSRVDMNRRFIGRLSRQSRILEVGTNAGNELLCLRGMGFKNLSGIDVQSYAAKKAALRVRGSRIACASAFDIPFDDGSFDLVYTTGVLIHIAPTDIPAAMSEIRRVSARFIWGLEYYAPRYAEIPYRGKGGLLWKTDFAKHYLKLCPGLRLVKQERYAYSDGSGNVDSMFLLEKT